MTGSDIEAFDTRPDVQKILNSIDMSGGSEACWPWMKSRTRGYGMTSFEGKTIRAHRFMLMRKLGRSLQPGEHACHACDNPPCCNPNHLWVGSHQENMADAVAKGRTLQKGHIHPNWTPANALKTSCKRGHPLSGENLYVNPIGARICRTCMKQIRIAHSKRLGGARTKKQYAERLARSVLAAREGKR